MSEFAFPSSQNKQNPFCRQKYAMATHYDIFGFRFQTVSLLIGKTMFQKK
jgi:hypothetical protein